MGFLHRAICVHSQSQGVHEEERINTKEQQGKKQGQGQDCYFLAWASVYSLELPENY